MEPISQNPQISTDPETKGFDLSAGKTWVYPENFPVRNYQFNIVQNTLYNNTLVCLPTGLGKTFIAAVVMYNFWRWYPCGKVVFLAPTKPLVAQQIYACHNVMGIPSTETIELTGAVNQKQREIAWNKKRVVFATPQVFHNDLEKNVVPAELVKCVVVDEAHKALGKHSYCECVRILSEKNEYFRILALSATPGNKIDNVHEVLQNLHISQLELRDDTSPDIVPYINERKIDIVLVPLSDQLAKYKERYIFIMDRHVKLLLQHNVLQGHAANISKGRVFHLWKEFQKKTNKSGNHGQIMKTLNILVTMYHAYDLMVRDGLRAFFKFYQNHSDKFWMNDEAQLQILLDDINMYLGPFPDINFLSNGSEPDVPPDIVFGHTKFQKLKEILLRHFSNSKENEGNTRAIVFVEYRDIVTEVYILLLQLRPTIRPQMFVGQAGQKQKQQIKALEDFRNNRVNVLISTSIGEEGLDVGEVDLIICFDISQQSPTRLVQRMGRTGRKRDGHIIILVTDGREHETLKSTMARRDSMNNKILNTSNIFASLYENSPRMIPKVFNPECHKMYINVLPKTPAVKTKNKKEKVEKKKGRKKNPVEKKVTETAGVVKNKSQSSMTRFLKGDKCNDEDDGVFVVSNSLTTQSTNNCNAIKPCDVKLLSCDNHAVDFLTLCALKKSEKEENSDTRENLNSFYFCNPAPIKDFFDFSIPDHKVLDCLSSLKEVPPRKVELQTQKLDVEPVDDNVNEISCSFEDVPEDVPKLSDDFDDFEPPNLESKFEDLLDTSSKSNETMIFDAVEDDLEVPPSPTFSSKVISPEKKNIEEEISREATNDVEDLEPGTFEQLLDESTDSFETTFLLEDRHSCAKNSTLSEEIDGFVDNRSVRRSVGNNNSMLTVTQAIHEIARINSTENMGSYNVESEDDMFEMDEALEEQINELENSYLENRGKETNEIAIEERTSDEEIFEIAEKSVLERSKSNLDLDIADCDWSDEFEGSTVRQKTPRNVEQKNPSCSTPKETKNNNDMLDDFSDSEWISIDSRSISKMREDKSNLSIAQKLGNVRKSIKSSENSKKRSNDTDDSTDDFVIDKKEIKEPTGSERSCFFERSKSFDVQSSSNIRGLLSLKRPKVQESGSKGLDVFAAPQKYLERKANSTMSLDRNVDGRKNDYKRKRRKRIRSEFICDEAEVSSDDTGDETSGTDEDISDFVSYTQNVQDTSDMHAHYLKSIRSPIKRQNAFLFKRPRSPDTSIEVYSQPISQTRDSYLYDSFCVDGDEENEASSRVDYSILDRAEEELKRRRRKRSRNDEGTTRRKRRRNLLNDSVSSEDETEKLRKQIEEESFLMKRSKRI